MEKLIELLNEYGNEICNHWGDYQTDMDFTDRDIYWYLSKKFGFIKWLVENDKIDLGEKLFNLTKNDSRKSTICDLDNNDFSWEDTFLMLLAISSSPIDDLISYLR